jgi:di/tripeptidase
MEEIHTPDERIAVSDVDGMVRIATELVRSAGVDGATPEPR